MQRLRAFLFLAIWLLAPWPGWATSVEIGELGVLLDPSGTETIESVSAPSSASRFQTVAGGFSRGYTNDVVWLRFQVPPPAAGNWWLEVRPVTLDDVRLYAPSGAAHGERRSGRLVPITQRDLDHPGFVFKLDLPDDKARTHYLRLHSGSTLAARLILWSPEAFLHAKWSLAGKRGLMAGVLVAMLLFNVALWVLLRERALLWLAFYTLALGLSWFLSFGYGAGLLLRESPTLNIRLVDVSSALYVIALCALLHSLLHMAKAMPARRWPFWLPVLHALVFLLEPGPALQPVGRSLGMLATSLWLLWLLHHGLRQLVLRGDWSRRLLLAAIANVQACNILMGLAVLGLLPGSGLPTAAYLLAGGSSLFTIQLAMLLRIHRGKRLQTELALQVHVAQAETSAQKAVQQQLSDALAELDLAQRAGRFGCWHWYKATDRIEVSPAARELVGDDLKDVSVTGTAFRARLTEPSRAALQRAMAGARKGVAPFAIEVQIVDDGAGPRWLELHGAAVLSAEGHTLGMSGTVQDISERRALADAQTAAEADRLARARESVFLSRASHELRTPLNAVMGLTQLLAESPGVRADAALCQQATMIVQASDELRALIDDILDLAALQRDTAVLPVQPVDVAPMLSCSITLLQPLAEARGVSLQLGEVAGASCADAHPDWLLQSLLNLVRNAIQYNRAGGSVTVSLRAQIGEPATPSMTANASAPVVMDGRLCIDVIDTGRGMTPEQCRSLFEPFNRLGATVTTVEGRGLGLSVTRQLVQAMGGDLQVHSEIGRGTTATLVLRSADTASPAARYPAGQSVGSRPGDATREWDNATPAAGFQATPHHPGESTASDDGCAPPMTVLYVEDNRLNATVMRQAVRRLPSVRLEVATSAEAALVLMQDLRPDLLLVDINLPGMSGIELRRHLRGVPLLAAVPCVAVSADATSETRALAMAEGFADYVAKPFKIERITGLLSNFRNTRQRTARMRMEGEPSTSS